MANFPVKDKQRFLQSRFEAGINWRWTDQVINRSLELTFYAYEFIAKLCFIIDYL